MHASREPDTDQLIRLARRGDPSARDRLLARHRPRLGARVDPSTGEIGVLYSVLCEFSHPNHRGVMAFKKAESIGEGWTIRYDLEEPFDTELATRLLDSLLVSMPAGYSASEMLRAWDFKDITGGIEWIWPTEETAKRVWTALIRRRL